MAMSIAALEIFEEAQFSPAQARALARVLESEITARRDELATKADLAATKSDLEIGLGKLRQDMTEGYARLEVKIENAKAESVRWTFLAMIGQVTMLAGLMYFLLQNVR